MCSFNMHFQNFIMCSIQCCSIWGKSLSLRTNLQVLVLGSQVLVLGPQSPWKFSGTLHSANCHLCMITWRPPPPCMRLRWRIAYLLNTDANFQVYVLCFIAHLLFLFLWQIIEIKYQLLSSLHTHLSPCPQASSPCPCPRAISPWLQHQLCLRI